MSKQPLFEIKNLKRYFPAKGGKTVKAVDDVTFDIFPGETFSLVGESGCGKTTCGRTILGVYPKTSGSILYEGEETAKMSKAQLRQFRRRNQMIFQDPYSCLDPRMTIGTIIQEGMNVHFKRTPAQRNEKVTELLFKVGLTADFASRFPMSSPAASASASASPGPWPWNRISSSAMNPSPLWMYPSRLRSST